MSQSPEDAYQAVLRTTWQQHIPFRVLWELTYRCNERCQHCYLVDHHDRGELTTTEAKRTIDQLAEAGCLVITLTGGEALLRADFFEIAAYARQRGFALRLLTNGTLITPEVADQLKALQFMSVEISLYGVRAETHDGVTQLPGSHARSLSAIQMLTERGVRVRLKSPLMERTVGEFDDLRALAQDLGARFVYDTTLAPADNGSSHPLAQAMQPKTLQEFYTRTLQTWEVHTPDPGAHLCSAGYNIGAIDPYGNILPCVQVRMPAGNLREQSFRAIWHESPILHHLREITFSQLKDCPSCELQPTCIRCPGVAYLEAGDLLACSQVARTDARMRRNAIQIGKINVERKNDDGREREKALHQTSCDC